MTWEEFKETVSLFEKMYEDRLRSISPHGKSQVKYTDMTGERYILPRENTEQAVRIDTISEVQHISGTFSTEIFGLQLNAHFNSHGEVDVHLEGETQLTELQKMLPVAYVAGLVSTTWANEKYSHDWNAIYLRHVSVERLKRAHLLAGAGDKLDNLSNIASVLRDLKASAEISALHNKLMPKINQASDYCINLDYSFEIKDRGEAYDGRAFIKGHDSKVKVAVDYTAVPDGSSLDWLVVGK